MFKTSKLLKPIALMNAIVWAAVVFLAPSPTLAQTDYARITVVVLSPVAGNIRITVVGEQGKVRECTTGPEGTCTFSALEPGTYGIQLPDLGKAINVSLLPGQSITRTIDTSQAGATFKANRTTLPRAEAEQTKQRVRLIDRIIPGRRGDRTTSQELEELPNRNQSEAPLLERQPGAVATGVDTFAGFIFNGQPGSQNVLRENGLSSNPIVRSSASFQDSNAILADIGDRQSIQAFETFALDTSNTPSSFGTGTGTQLVKIVKKGKDKFGAEIYEFLANDAFSARNFFDFDRKPSLRFNLFGFNVTGPLGDHLFAFFNYEGVRASSGNTLFAAAPKLSLATNADLAVAGLIRSFRASGASILGNASIDPNFDILQLEAKNRAERNGISTRIDYEPSDVNKFSIMYRGSRARTDFPDGVSGRRSISLDSSHKAVFNYEHTLTLDANKNPKLTNQFIIGIINSPTRLFARFEDNVGPNLFNSAINMGGEINQTTIAGQPPTLTVSTSGGLLGGDFKGRYLTFKPWQVSFIDQMNWTNGHHVVTFGGEIRLLHTSLDQFFGTTYNFSNLTDFLANHVAVEHSGDLGSLTGSPGPRHVSQTYYIGYVQHAWRTSETTSLTSGVRYEYYTHLRELNQSIVNIDPATGTLVPSSVDVYKSRKTNFLPRVAFVWAPRWRTPHPEHSDLKYGQNVVSASFGMHVGPDVFENILRPITNNRLMLAGENLAFPIDQQAFVASTPADDRQLKPLALSRDYTSPARVYKFDFSFKRSLVLRDPTTGSDDEVNKELFFTLAYVGSRSRGLLLRNFANRIVSVQTNPNPALKAIIRREFDIERDGQLHHPCGEFEFLTTGGRSSYDSFQASLRGHVKALDLVEFNYTLGRTRGNTDDTDAIGAGNPFDYNYDFGFNAADVRHQFNFTTVLSVACLFSIECRLAPRSFKQTLLRGWQLATIGLFQSGPPVDVRIDRPDIVYVDQAGNVFTDPAIGRTAVLNTPGGGSPVAAYRPNLIAGAIPYLRNDRSYLDPRAFSIPAPGTLGNLTRGALRGPGVRFVDFSLRKEFKFGAKDEEKTFAFNVDVTNLFNFTNFKLPKATLPNKLGTEDSKHELQPNQAFTPEAAPTFGVITRTFKRKPELGASRQIQFGVSLQF